MQALSGGSAAGPSSSDVISWEKMLQSMPQDPSAKVIIAAVGLDNSLVSDRVKTVIGKLRSSITSSNSKSIAALEKNTTAARGNCDGLDVDDEPAFRAAMKGRAVHLAKLHAAIVASRAELADDKMFDTETQQFLTECDAIAGKSMYYITVYTAITLWRNPNTWVPSKSGSAQKGKLQGVLRMLNDPSLLAVEQAHNHQLVKNMRVDAGIVQPPAPAAFGQGAVSSGSALAAQAPAPAASGQGVAVSPGSAPAAQVPAPSASGHGVAASSESAPATQVQTSSAAAVHDAPFSAEVKPEMVAEAAVEAEA